MVTNAYIKSDESDLVGKTLDGDNNAFGEIVRRYEDMVARTVKSMLGEGQQADDAGQDTFIRLYKGLKDFRGDSKLSTYIQRIAVNQCLNEIRRSKRFSPLIYQSGESDEEVSYEPVSDETEKSTDIKEIVNMALSKLDTEFRAVVVLRMVQGYSTKETAEILELPMGTVLSRLSRAKEQLRKYLTNLL